jgi:hypothetical protein
MTSAAVLGYICIVKSKKLSLKSSNEIIQSNSLKKNYDRTAYIIMATNFPNSTNN